MRYVKIDFHVPHFAPPSFMGSMLRGAFGHGLKRVVCVNPTKECEGCYAQVGCAFYEFFEEKAQYLPYRFAFSLNQKSFDFSLYLFNEAVVHTSQVIRGLHFALTHLGLGKNRIKVKPKHIHLNDELIFDKEFKNFKVEPKFFKNDEFSPEIKVEFLTPVRIKRGGKLLNVYEMDIKDILISTVKKRKFFDNVDTKIENFPEIVQKNLFNKDFTRYSNRQKSKMKIGGVMGNFHLKNLTPQTYDLLLYGELCGVGKLCTFGLGHISLERI